MQRFFAFSALCGIVLCMTARSYAAAFTDTFDSIDSAWVTDRYEADEFVVDNFDGDNRLKIGISTADSAANRPGGFSGMFYNTQGRQRPATISGAWSLSADLYASSGLLDASSGSSLQRMDLWGRDSNIEALAQYPIIGATNASPTDGFNTTAGDRSSRYRVWDGDTANGWVDIVSVTPTLGWHNLNMVYNGLSAIDFYIDGTNVYTDNTVSIGALADLQTAFLEAYNFGDSSYAVHWDNLNVGVPEPGSLALIGFGGLVFLHRRRRVA